MLRIHFTAGDLSRTRVADGPDPLWEVVLSLHQLQERHRDSVLDGWQHRAGPGATGAARFLKPLMPPRGYFPDFLTPAAASGGLDSGIDAVLSTPRRQLRAELTDLAGANALPGWTRALADGETGVLHRLGRALRTYHATALGPVWPHILRRIDADRLRRTRTQWRSGTEAMLRGFAPLLRWESPVLCAAYPADRDLHLAGRGLLLVPSYFCRRTPVVLANGALMPVLVYPALVPRPTAPAAPFRRLAPLLGHTRAAVLQALQVPCTTSELAAHAGVSLSSASEHAAVLRRAGLVATTRDRQRVHHALTPLGTRLLMGQG